MAGGKKDKKEKPSAQDTGWYALLYKTWKITDVDVPSMKGNKSLASDFAHFSIKLSPDHHFVISSEDFLYTGEFFAVEKQYRKYLVADFLTFEITGMGLNNLELFVKTPIPQADKVKIFLHACKNDEFNLPVKKLCTEWAFNSSHYYSPNEYLIAKKFIFRLNKDGNYEMLNDTVNTHGTWTLDKTDLSIKLEAKGKPMVFFIKMYTADLLSLSPNGYPDSIMGFTKSYGSMDNTIKENYSYSSPNVVADDYLVIDSVNTGIMDTNAVMTMPDEPRAVEGAQNNNQTGEKIYDFVEEMPQFPGGEAACTKYISTHIIYPPAAVEHGVEGKVILTFTVDTDGSISDIKIVKNQPMGCGEEAVRVVKAMPKWKPGRQNGKAVKTRLNLPVSFKLEN